MSYAVAIQYGLSSMSVAITLCGFIIAGIRGTRRRTDGGPILSEDVVKILAKTCVALGCYFIGIGVVSTGLIIFLLVGSGYGRFGVWIVLIVLLNLIVGPGTAVLSIVYILKRHIGDRIGYGMRRGWQITVVVLLVITTIGALATVALHIAFPTYLPPFLHQSFSGLGGITTGSDMSFSLAVQTPLILLLTLIPQKRKTITCLALISALADVACRLFSIGLAGTAFCILPITLLTVFPLCYVRRAPGADNIQNASTKAPSNAIVKNASATFVNVTDELEGV